jgi:hypothetical protein
MGSHRSFATRYNPGYGNDVTSSFSFPANVALPGRGTRNPNLLNCGPDSLRDANFPNQCRFDNSPFDSLQPARRVPTIRPRSLQPTARTGSLSISSIAILQMACDTRRTPPTPSAASANNFIGGYDLTYGDPRGRFVYANVTYSAR